MNIHDIVKDWLTTHGYDGLAGDECGCQLDDLMPCGCSHETECVAGKLSTCDRCHGTGIIHIETGPHQWGETCELCCGSGKTIIGVSD